MKNFRKIAFTALAVGISGIATLSAYDSYPAQGETVYNQQGGNWTRGQDGSYYQQDGSYQDQGGYQGQQRGYQSQGGYQGQGGYQDSRGYQGGNQGGYQGQGGYYQQDGSYQDQGGYQGQQRGYYNQGNSSCSQCQQYRNQRQNQGQYQDQRANQNDTSNDAVNSRVTNALQNDSSLSANARNVQASTVDGKVTLTGTVKNDDEKAKVEAIAKKVNGVKSVTNNVTVSNQ